MALSGVKGLNQHFYMKGLYLVKLIKTNQGEEEKVYTISLYSANGLHFNVSRWQFQQHYKY